MKELKQIKLTQLSKAELSKKEMNKVLGGGSCCACGCQGPSSSFDNANANQALGIMGPGGGGPVGSYGG